ncbi:MAG: hypothetical protein MUC38_05460 [Cyclobacteriaceae bacterium]|jgi:hypothetical protein|nr:hypothetical protein [Cyclobacteriaceae bacterium]
MKNYLSRSLYLVLLTVSMVTAVGLFTPFQLAGLQIKKVNLAADIQKDKLTPSSKPVAQTQRDSIRPAPKPEPQPVRNGPKGITHVEDFSENEKGLKEFSEALRSANRQPVRIAFFGDSFIEGDIVSGSLRDTLQRLFGGRGVGYVPLASEVAQYRTTVQHTHEHWITYSMVNKRPDSIRLGFPGYCFVPLAGNRVMYQPPKRGGHVIDNLLIYYQSTADATLHCTVNDTLHQALPLPWADSLAEVRVAAERAKSVGMHIDPHGGVRLFGASLEYGNGVYVDNFAMRGNSGMGLGQLDEDAIRQFQAYRNYRLLILQYGLNVVTEKDTVGYGWYVDKMVRVVKRLKQLLPKTAIVIMSVSDRSYNEGGTYQTLPGIPVMRDAQRDIARKAGVCFWDLYAAMGGENSMPRYVQAQPPLAAKDYTHLTFRGGKKIARLFAEALLTEHAKYEPK